MYGVYSKEFGEILTETIAHTRDFIYFLDHGDRIVAVTLTYTLPSPRKAKAGKKKGAAK